MSQLDIFGNPFHGIPSVQAEHDPRIPGLKNRILQFFKDHKYQSYTEEDLVKEFSQSKPTVIRSAITQLMKHGKLVATGDFRGAGKTSACITLNLHRRR